MLGDIRLDEIAIDDICDPHWYAKSCIPSLEMQTELNVFLDADTVILGDVSLLFDSLLKEQIIWTQLRDWTTQTDRVVENRLIPLLDIVPERFTNREWLTLIGGAMIRPYPTVNTGVFAWRGNPAPLVDYWQRITWEIRDTVLGAEEVAATLLVQFDPQAFVSCSYNDVVTKDYPPSENTTIIHCVNCCHLDEGKKWWLPAYELALSVDVCGINSFGAQGDKKLQHYLNERNHHGVQAI